MDSFNDVSQLSDVQSTSRIPRWNNSRMVGRINSLQNLFEHQSSTLLNTTKTPANLNQGNKYFDKTIKSLTVCEDSISEYTKNKVILECMKEVSLKGNHKLPETIAEKLKGLLMIYEAKKYMYLKSVSKDPKEKLTVLGITDLPKYDLTYEEKLDLKCCIEAMLREKIHNFITRYESLGGNTKEVVRSNDCNSRRKLFEPKGVGVLQWHEKLDSFCTQYETDVLKFRNLLNEWNKLKYTELAQIYLGKAEYLLLQTQVAEVQAKITKLTCIIRMFKETPLTIDAFQILNDTIDNKLFTLMNDIKEKEDLKKSYENLQNTEYDEVLKSYLQLCKAIKKKTHILQNI